LSGGKGGNRTDGEGKGENVKKPREDIVRPMPASQPEKLSKREPGKGCERGIKKRTLDPAGKTYFFKWGEKSKGGRRKDWGQKKGRLKEEATERNRISNPEKGKARRANKKRGSEGQRKKLTTFLPEGWRDEGRHGSRRKSQLNHVKKKIGRFGPMQAKGKGRKRKQKKKQKGEKGNGKSHSKERKYRRILSIKRTEGKGGQTGCREQ